MSQLTFCRFTKSVGIIVGLTLAPFGATQAIDYSVLLSPPPQSNAKSCQSYSLAVALALADSTGRYIIKSNDDLPILEGEIRLSIEKAMKAAGRTESTRGDWKEAIEKLSFGDF